MENKYEKNNKRNPAIHFFSEWQRIRIHHNTARRNTDSAQGHMTPNTKQAEYIYETKQAKKNDTEATHKGGKKSKTNR